jgi:hypothetical protein
MLLGEKYKLDTPTLGLAANRRRQVLVPAESVIEIVSVPTAYQRMVDVLWDGQPLTMFVHDVDFLGPEVAEPESFNLIARA